MYTEGSSDDIYKQQATFSISEDAAMMSLCAVTVPSVHWKTTSFVSCASFSILIVFKPLNIAAGRLETNLVLSTATLSRGSLIVTKGANGVCMYVLYTFMRTRMRESNRQNAGQSSLLLVRPATNTAI